jgi:hypothetical protein
MGGVARAIAGPTALSLAALRGAGGGHGRVVSPLPIQPRLGRAAVIDAIMTGGASMFP